MTEQILEAFIQWLLNNGMNIRDAEGHVITENIHIDELIADFIRSRQ